MRLQIATKIVVLTVTGILIAAISVMTVTFLLMRNASNLQLDSMVRQSKITVEESYKDIEMDFIQTNTNMAMNSEMIQIVHSGDISALMQWSKEVMNNNGADLCTITDAKGIVLARAHSDKKGDSLADQDMVRAALQGQTVSGIVVSTVIPISIRACCNP